MLNNKCNLCRTEVINEYEHFEFCSWNGDVCELCGSFLDDTNTLEKVTCDKCNNEVGSRCNKCTTCTQCLNKY